jgi:quinol monooxygenase YgiN
MEEVNLVVMIEVMPGKRDLQIEAYKNLKPLVLAEPGCLQYELFSDAADENKFLLIERWTSQDALDAHDQTEHMIAADAHSPTFRAKPAQVIKMATVTA